MKCSLSKCVKIFKNFEIFLCKQIFLAALIICVVVFYHSLPILISVRIAFCLQSTSTKFRAIQCTSTGKFIAEKAADEWNRRRWTVYI